MEGKRMGLTQIQLPETTLIPIRRVSKPICLIIPPSPFLLDERVFPSLGITKVAAVLEKAGAKIEMLDLSGVTDYVKIMERYARELSVSTFGITATTPQMPATMDIAQAIRRSRNSSNTKIILGGPHVTMTNAAYKNELKSGVNGRSTAAMDKLKKFFDVLVAGDGEEAVFQALQNDAPKVIDADQIKVDGVKSPLFLNGDQLDQLPFPARHLLDIESYKHYIDGELTNSLIAQLGCPFGCGFCGGRLSPSFRQIRTRSSENIVMEMEHLYRTTGRKGFMLMDDELNVNRNMVGLMRLIERKQKELGVEWKLRGFIKAQLFNDEQAESMYAAGFRVILVGFESGSPEILEAIQKSSTLEENTRCMQIAHRHGLKVKALMSVGHPSESEITIQATKKWLLEVKPADFDVTIITPYPGTPYHDDAVPHPTDSGVWVYTFNKTGAKLYQYEVDYTKVANYYKGDPNDGYRSYVFTDHLSAADLVRLRDMVEREVREKLNIPFYQKGTAVSIEHSMGQMGPLPSNILRKGANAPTER